MWGVAPLRSEAKEGASWARITIFIGMFVNTARGQSLTDEGMVSDVWVDGCYEHLGTDSVTIEEIIERLT